MLHFWRLFLVAAAGACASAERVLLLEGIVVNFNTDGDTLFSNMITDSNECLSLCVNTPGCNIVMFGSCNVDTPGCIGKNSTAVLETSIDVCYRSFFFANVLEAFDPNIVSGSRKVGRI